jgi:Concanavalin A-like lectin/glucanases superfamily
MTAGFKMGNVKLFLLSIVLLLLLVCNVYAALDAPHNDSKGIGCDSCHDVTAFDQPKLMPAWTAHAPADIDDTPFNSLCWSCHNDVVAPYVKTHSSLQGGDNYGNWTVECWVCHNQHTQAQNNVNGSSHGQFIREKIRLDNITGTVPAKLGNKSVMFLGSSGPNSFADGDGVYDGICEVCHTKTKYFRNNGTGIDQNHGGRNGTNCISCHNHTNGFIHGGGSGGGGCISCHGHDTGYEYSPGEFSQGAGTTGSHSTHTESDADDLKGPHVNCNNCHDTDNFPYFLSGTDSDGDGKYSLAETDVCDTCHSQGGPFDGVDDAAFGAKSNWSNGVYAGNTLITDKEQWCVGCHDSGTSLIGGKQAPDVAGNNSTYGYYQSGHGAFFTECGECHGLGMDHNFDGQKTYDSAAGNYKQGFRLSDVDGGDPMNIQPIDTSDRCNYTDTDYRLCFSCHSAQMLLQDTRIDYGCDTNPYEGAASVTTGFRDESGLPPTNIHWYHLGELGQVGNLNDSDGDGTMESETSCMTCHNPHGVSRADNSTPTVRMTTRELGISTGTDGTGDFGQGPDPSHPCGICHSSATKYYRDAPPPANPTRPDTPVNADPLDGATDLLQPPTFTASAFSDSDVSDTHQNSQWLVSSASGDDFKYNLLYDSGIVAGSNSHIASMSWSSGATYYWKVRYQDNHGIWSEYSADTGFTILTNSVPAQPIHVSPAQGAMNVDRRPLLVASPFYDDDAGDSHESIVWQISTNDETNFGDGLVHTSGHISPTTNPSEPYTTSYAVPDQLDANRRYFWRTRYKDSKGQWSDISPVTSFTTSSLITKFEFEDDDTGNIASDSVEDNDGTIINGAAWTTGFSGQGLYFDGTNDEMSWSYANEVPLDTFTMEAMVKATTTHQIDAEAGTGTAGMSGQRYVFVTTAIGGSQAGAGVSVGTNGISVYEHSGGFLPPVAVYNPAAKTPVQPQLGTDWNHLVVTYTDTQPRIYLNGRLVHTGLDSIMTDVFAPIQLGHGTYGGFTGTIDEVAIYNKALTKTEVLQRCLELGKCNSEDLDNDGVTDSEDNCPLDYNPDQADLNGNGIGNICDYIGFWKLNEGNGYSTADESERNHAAIGHFEQWTAGVAGGSAFAGNGTYNSVSVNNILDNHNGDFSLSIWLKFPTGTTNPKWSLGKGDAFSGIGFGIAHWVETDDPIPPGLFLNDGTAGAAHRKSLYASSIPRDTWGHFVWTIDRTNNVMKVYKNGQYEAQLDISDLGTNAVTGNGVLDFATPTNMFTGALDNVGVYDFVLEPGDIQARFETDLRHLDSSPAQYSISLADNNSGDPVAAESGYTNNRSVSVTVSINNGSTTPTQMEFAEDLAFSNNPTGWIAFNSTYTYELSAGDGTKEIYCRLNSAGGQVALLRAGIVLDTIAPAVSTSALTAPNNSETWDQGTSEDITWTPDEITDANLEDSPVSLAYSTNSGSSFPNSIATNEANDGIYPWSVPVDESSTVQVRLTATDKAGNQGYDSSEADFTIDSVTPVLTSITLVDNNSADPAEAEAGYTNNQSVLVSLVTTNYPTHMKFTEDTDDSNWLNDANPATWIAYSENHTYDLTAGEGDKTVHAKVKNSTDLSNSLSYTIKLDMTNPTIQTDTLTAPNGHTTRWMAEFWEKGSTETISWTDADINDANPKTNPIFIRYSSDSGGTWPTTVAGNEVANDGEANDGSYDWNITVDTTHYARVRLAARDKAGNEATDDSDNDFNLSPPQGYIVTNTNDSGAGSLRQALADLQAAGGNSPIWFNIPTASLANGVAMLDSAAELPWLVASSIVDGGSQTILRGDSNTNGPEIRIHYTGSTSISGLGISGNFVTIKGLQFTNFYRGVYSVGEDASIQSCQFGFSSDSTGYVANPNSYDIWLTGRSNVDNGNYFACSSAGVRISGSSDTSVKDNSLGFFPDGTACTMTGSGITIGGGAETPHILNNIIHSASNGIRISGYNESTDGAVFQGNQIGAVYSAGSWTNLTGPTYGIYIESKYGGNHTIGGAAVASSDSELNQSNVISADEVGIYIKDVEDNTTVIHGNFIGTNPEQDEVFTGDRGIVIGNPYTYGLRGVTVGGGGEGQAGNVIANMSQYGLSIEGTGNLSKEHVFSKNLFYNNGNDSADDAIYLSTSGNGTIPRPVIAELTSIGVRVDDLYGGYSATSGDVIEVYYADFDGTEYGEGKVYIASGMVSQGSTSVTVDISGANAGAGINNGDWITVTKTNVFRGTSAFSANVRLTGPAVPTLTWTGESNYTTDGVDPDSGAQLGNFTFRVKYTDADNDSPWPIEVWIDADDNDTYAADELFAMTAVDGGDPDYTDGKLYTYSMVLPYVGDGILKYRFYASDARSTATGAPAADNTVEVINGAPDTPTIATPADGEVDVPQPIVLTASAFVDADTGDTHQSSQWLISSVSGTEFDNNLLYDSGVFDPSTLHVPDVSVTQGTTYYWKVRYQDNHGLWSDYSTEASFTLVDNSPPDTPVHVTPAHGDRDVSGQPTLTAEAFSDADVGDTHQGSIWQVSTASGDDFVAGLVYNSGIVAASTSYVVPVTLDPNTVYFWRARYQDDKDQWSALSADTRFKTTSIESHYRFDEGTGVLITDSAGSNNGWIQNDPTGAVWIAGFNGQALKFDGINDGVSWNYAGVRPSNNFAMEAMVKATTTHQTSDAESTVSTTGTSGQNYLFDASFFADPDAGAGVSLGTNGISVYEHSGGYMPPLARYVPAEKTPLQPQLGTEWNHVIVSYQERQPRIYLNGRLVHVGLQSPKTTVYAPIVLANGGYGKFAGDIDEVVIHKASLTEADALSRCIEVGKCADADLDSDGVTDSVDNCAFEYNPDQADLDNDGSGNVCDYMSYWKMDDGSGSIAVDEAESNNITLSGGTTWSTGINGSGGLVFDGANVAARADNILDNWNKDFSISIWLKFPTGAINPKWSLGKGFDPYRSLGFGIGHWVTTDTPVAPSLIINDGTQGAFLDPEWEWPNRIGLPPSSIPRGTWGHFVWTIDRTNHVMKVYKNGQYDGERDISRLGTNALSDDKLFNLGRAGDNANMYTGSMDNVAVYDFVLQPGDVQARCEADAGVGNCP